MIRFCQLFLLIALAVFLSTQAAMADSNRRAAAVLEAAGNPGGLAVVVGTDDGQLVAALAEADTPLLVEGLESDPGKVAATQAMLAGKGHAGKATVRLWNGQTLPYVDNVVRLIVVSKDVAIDKEIERVLCPGGMSLAIDAAGNVSLRSRKSDTLQGKIDDWTHYLKDASGNAVSQDQLIGPPRKMQWLAEPLWSRNHHKLASISSVVTNDGRIFYIMDDGPAANMAIPGRWSLIARDAYSGTLLWKKPYTVWHSQSHGFRSGPVHLPRLLVADKTPKGRACIFAKPGFDQPIEVLDAATGEILHSLKDTEQAEEIIHEDGVLLTVLGDPTSISRSLAAKRHGAGTPELEPESVAAFDTSTGEMLWKKPLGMTGFIASLTLSADKNDRVFVQNEKNLFCLDLKSGEQKWSVDLPGIPAKGAIGSVLVVTDGEVFIGDGKTVNVFDIETGEKLWNIGRGAGFRSPTDVLVQDGLVWLGPEFAKGLDLRTGQVKETTIKTSDVKTVGHHHRCYRQKATERYLLEGYRGIEFYDTEKGEHSRHNWVRGTCQYGIMPANGLMYAPPHACGCFMEAKLRGFWALATDDKEVAFDDLTDTGRLAKGPAYGSKASETKAAWPTLRGNTERSGISEAKLPGKLTQAWETDLGGPITAPILADRMVFVAATDEHKIVALDAKDGKVQWTFSAAGRVDSPPTWHAGLLLFGSCDGYVYALDAKSGKLAWKFLAAPEEKYTVVRDQVESIWPVAGTVLVQNGTAYVAAGRSTYIDGGIALWGLDPMTGQVKSHSMNRRDNIIVTADTKTTGSDPSMRSKWTQNMTDEKTFLDSDLADAFSMAGNVGGILSGNGESVFLRHEQFDGDLNRQDEQAWHLFSTSTLLDDAENHRSHWVLGYGDFKRLGVAYSWIANRKGGSWGQKLCNPYGIMLSFDAETVWGVRRHGGGYALFTEPNQQMQDGKTSDFRDPKSPEAQGDWTWSQSLTLRPHAMLRAADKVILAGMPTLSGDNIDAFEGRARGILAIRSAADGSEVSQIDINAAPVWDGLAVDNGLLIISCKDGCVRGMK